MALIKCKECKKEISSNATVCPNCGYKNINNNEKPSFGILLLCFLIPIIGIILFAINISTKPRYAKQCIIASLLCFIILFIIWIIIVIGKYCYISNNGSGLTGISATSIKHDNTNKLKETTTNEKIENGMSKFKVLSIWGNPDKAENDKWIYENKGIIYFKDDVVISIQE